MSDPIPTRATHRRRPGAVILAGGRGTRLAPLTTVLPKPLMPLGDGPILDVLLRQLGAQGFSEVTLSVGHMAELIRTFCGRERHGVRLRYVQEDTPLGTVGALALLPEAMRRRSLIVMNGDLLTTLRFADLVDAHRRSGATASIAVMHRPVQMEFGVMDLGEDVGPARRILDYREKPEIPATVSMGVYVFEPEAIGLITPGERLDLPDLVLRLIRAGHTVAGYEFAGYWLDIGRHADYERALDDFERLRHELVPDPPATPAKEATRA